MKSVNFLIQYAIAQLGRPYWFGTFGQTTTEKLWEEKSRQYKNYYSDSRKKKAIPAQLGKKAHDCIGLCKGALWCDTPGGVPKYNAKEDWSADSTYNKATVKGPISSMPDRPGICLWRKGHWGVYIGNGEIVEAKGFDYGVIKSKVAGSTFTNWCEHPLFDYSAVEAPVTAPQDKPTNEPQKNLDAIVREVRAGKYGNEPERSKKLRAAGYNPEEVQAAVNAQIQAEKNQKAPADQKPTNEYIVATEKSGLNVRSTPGGAIIGSLNKGAVVKIASINNGWAKLEGRSGYVSVQFLKKK